MLKDMSAHFELYQPADLAGAFDLLNHYGKDGWALAGGYDSLDWFKDRAKQPQAVVDLSGIAELQGIRETANGIEIGAMETLTAVATHPAIVERYSLLADAADKVASPQIRNNATIGGNVAQDARCWYYRYGLPCYRAGGNVCYADAPDGQNREHAILGADRCVAVTPSDTAPALVALDAQMVIRNARRERVVPAEEFFVAPGTDITRMTVLEPGDVLATIRIPNDWANASFYFEKVAERNTWDFALVSVAAAKVINAGRIERIRLACGAVSCTPLRLTSVERMVTGMAHNDVTAGMAGPEAVKGAVPLNYNHFKLPLMENLVRRAVAG